MPLKNGWDYTTHVLVVQQVSLVCNEQLLTLMRSAPSLLTLLLEEDTKLLRRDWMIIEFGLDTEAEDWEPKRSSGSQSNSCIKLMASWDTDGREGKRRDCFQFRIFCRVT